MSQPIANPTWQGNGRDGFVVVTVLWMLSAISLLFLVYSAFVAESVPSFVVHENRLSAEALASAALELTAYRQLQKPRLERPSRGKFNFRLDRANVAVSFRSEASRIDLNVAPLPLLSGLFTALGARDADADLYKCRRP
jgi:general secretion pathway protein K